jgi:methylase of polypeptide subunit release factors
MQSLSSSDNEHQPWREALTYVTETGGSAPSLFAETISKTLPIEPGKTRLLDIGCGSGIIGLYTLVKRKAAFVTFNDIQKEMIAAARVNADKQIMRGAISDSQVAYLGGDFKSISAQAVARHNLVSFNPPQLPSDALSAKNRAEIEEDQSLSYFRLGGPDGLRIVRDFFHWYSQLADVQPEAVILLSSFLGLSKIRAAIRESNLKSKILTRTTVPLREILSDAAERLSAEEMEDRSLKRTDQRRWTKELLTISVQQIA